MARKASIKNLKKAADDTAARVSELEKQLEEAKAKQVEAQNKVREREKEIQQEENNVLAEKVRNFFGEDIIPEEFEKEMNELMLINEVKEYIESERAKRKAAAEKNIEAIIPAEDEIKEEDQNDSMVSDNIMIAQNP
jgi:hypothetical protein